MPEAFPLWMGDLNDVLSQPYSVAVITLASVACGAAIGVERGKRDKPAGLRSMMLICLGATAFTLVGQWLSAPGSDPARISAQVVTGVGFLGAGAIIRGVGRVKGITTAAAIWVVSAIGVVIGAGYVVAGVCFTLLAAATLGLESTLDRVIDGPCDWHTVKVQFSEQGGKTRWLIQGLLDAHEVGVEHVQFDAGHNGAGVMTLRYCRQHRQHRIVLEQLAGMTHVQRIEY